MRRCDLDTEIGGQRLDPLGRGVGFRAFHDYMVQVLVDYDTDVAAQEMIVEQFIAPWMWHFASVPVWCG